MLLVWLSDWLLLTAVGTLVGNWPVLRAGAVALAVMVAATLWAASRLHERLTAHFMGARRAAGQEESIITAAVSAVEDRLAQTYQPLVLVLDQPLPMSWAVGRHTILVTKGLLSFCSAGELAGVIAHEAGHQLRGHARRRQILRLLCLLGSLAGAVEWAVLRLGLSLGTGRRQNAAGQATALLWQVLVALVRAGGLARQAFLAAGFRREEYAADAFAARLGLGETLACLLARLACLDGSRGVRLWHRMWLDHPSYGERLARLTAAR